LQTDQASYVDALFSVTGKVALVTGGAGGIGRRIASGLTRNGCRVYITSRDRDAGYHVAEELSQFYGAGRVNPTGKCIALHADLSTEPGCLAVAQELQHRETQLNILVNNAGETRRAPLDTLSDDDWNTILAINLKAVSHMAKYTLPLLRADASDADPARIINIGSIDGLRAAPTEMFPYAASKAGVHHLTRAMALHLAPTITANAIAPGPFESKMLLRSIGEVGMTMADDFQS